MSNADPWPTALELITAEWLPRQTVRDASDKTDRRGWGAAVLRVLCLRPWRIASSQWHRIAAPGEDDNQESATAQFGDELALVVFFSLTGLDLTLWLLAKGALAGVGGLFAALMPR